MILNELIKIFNNFGKIIRNLPSGSRRLILISIDCFTIIFAFLLSISFFDNQIYYKDYILSSIFIALSGILFYLKGGQYKGISRYRSESYVERIFLTNFALSIFCLLIIFF